MKIKKMYIYTLLFLSLTVNYVTAQSSATGESEIDKLLDRGINYELTGNLDAAIINYRLVLEADSTNVPAQVRLAKLLSWQLKLDEALAILDPLLEKNPDMSEAVFRKAQILSWMKRYDESILLYRHYLELEPENPDGFGGIARTYFWSEDYDNAVIYFNKAIEAGYYNVTECRLNLAKIYLNRNDPENAKKELELVFLKEPENRQAKELYSSLPLFMKYEASLALRGEQYPDSLFGIKASPFFVYRPGKSWELLAGYDYYALDGKSDSTLTAGAVFKGLKGLSIGSEVSITPSPDYFEAFNFTNYVSYSITRKIGTGLTVESLFYKNNENPVLEDETLYIIKPSISYFFTDISNATVQYISYKYAEGFSASAVSLNIVIEYYKDNPLNFALTYGGDYESKNNDRNIFEAGGGLSYKFTNNFELSFNYNHVKSEYSDVNQFTITPIYRW